MKNQFNTYLLGIALVLTTACSGDKSSPMDVEPETSQQITTLAKTSEQVNFLNRVDLEMARLGFIYKSNSRAYETSNKSMSILEVEKDSFKKKITEINDKINDFHSQLSSKIREKYKHPSSELWDYLNELGFRKEHINKVYNATSACQYDSKENDLHLELLNYVNKYAEIKINVADIIETDNERNHYTKKHKVFFKLNKFPNRRQLQEKEELISELELDLERRMDSECRNTFDTVKLSVYLRASSILNTSYNVLRAYAKLDKQVEKGLSNFTVHFNNAHDIKINFFSDGKKPGKLSVLTSEEYFHSSELDLMDYSKYQFSEELIEYTNNVKSKLKALEERCKPVDHMRRMEGDRFILKFKESKYDRVIQSCINGDFYSNGVFSVPYVKSNIEEFDYVEKDLIDYKKYFIEMVKIENNSK